MSRLTFHDLPESAPQAWRILFGQAEPVTAERFHQLTPGDLKAAFRARVFETHPDRASVLGVDPGVLHQRFRRTVWAYESLKPLVGAILIGGAPAQPVRSRPAPTRTPAETRSRPRRGPTPSTDERRQARPRQESRYYSGPVPSRTLRLGEYLFYNQRVSWQELIAALVWQRQARPLVGEIALRWRLLSELDLQAVVRLRRVGELFGECAVRAGLISPFWLRVILHQQGKLQPKLGTYFLDQGLVGPDDLDSLLSALSEHNSNTRRF